MPKQPARQRRGGQPGNENAKKHGHYTRQPRAGTGPVTLTVADLIREMEQRQLQILEFAQKAADEGDTESALRALALYSQNASRLARMVQHSGAADPVDLHQKLQEALDLAQLGIEEEIKRSQTGKQV